MAKGNRGGQRRGGESNPAVEKTLNSIIKRTANLKKEQYRVIDDDGNVVFHKQGFNDRVEMTVGDKRQYLDGATTIHNHPNETLGGTFSSNDLTDFGYGAKEIVVATPEGTYRLKNMKWGTKDQSSGWYEMREKLRAMDNAVSSADHIRKVNDIMSKSKVGKDLKATSDKWVKRKAEGASQSELQGYMDKYTKLEAEYRNQRKAVSRKLEVQDYHEFYKKNAKKYGFKYTYPKAAD